jgi:pimeloyl-ACP methyl ester carboxylesterase
LTGSSILHELGDGDGFAVVFHNGTPCCRLMPEWWDAPARERGLRMIGVDRAGYGNAPAELDRSLHGVVDATAALMDELGVDRFPVIGVSGGGRTRWPAARPCPTGSWRSFQPRAAPGSTTRSTAPAWTRRS